MTRTFWSPCLFGHGAILVGLAVVGIFAVKFLDWVVEEDEKR